MNIVILSHYAGSENMGKATRHFYLAKQWVKMGHKVTIISASFSHLRSKNPFIERDFQKITEGGVEFRFVSTPLYTVASSLKKKNIFSYVYATWKNANALASELTPDVVVCASSYAFDIYPAAKIAKATGAKIVYEISCLLPDYLIDIEGYEKNDMMVKLSKMAQKKAIDLSSAVVSTLPFANEYLEKLGIEAKNYHYIPEGSDLIEIDKRKAPKHKTILKRFKDNGKFTVVYLGGLELDDALQDFVLAAPSCPKAMFVLIGNGLERLRLKKLTSAKGITNVDFIDKVPRNGVISALQEADCLYLGTKNSDIYDYGIGIDKLLDYMAAARPIICAINTKDDTIKESDCAVIIEPENPQAIADAVQKLSSMSEKQLDEMGLRGREYCEKNFNYERLSKQYIDIIESIINNENKDK